MIDMIAFTNKFFKPLYIEGFHGPAKIPWRTNLGTKKTPKHYFILRLGKYIQLIINSNEDI